MGYCGNLYDMYNREFPGGRYFRRFVEPGQEVEYGQKLGVILDPFTAEVGKNADHRA